MGRKERKRVGYGGKGGGNTYKGRGGPSQMKEGTIFRHDHLVRTVEIELTQENI